MKLRSHDGKKRATVWGSNAILYRRCVNNGGWQYRVSRRRDCGNWLFAVIAGLVWVMN